MLKIDPTHAESFARVLVTTANQAREGECVAVLPGEPGSGTVNIGLRPLAPDAPLRRRQPALGSMSA